MAGLGGKTEYSALNSDAEIRKVVMDLSQDVNNFIIVNRNYLSEDEELVDLFFEILNKTLDLRRVNKYTGEFATQYESVNNKQVMLLAKSHALRVVLAKMHKNARRWSSFGYFAFGAALPPLAAISLVALTSPISPGVPLIITAGKKAMKSLKKHTDFGVDEEDVERQYALCLLIEKCSLVISGVMETIKNRKSSEMLIED